MFMPHFVQARGTVDVFSTDRLLAQRLTTADFDDLYRMNQNRRVMETLGGLRSIEETREYLSHNLEHWDRHGYGLWLLRCREDGAFAGRSALRKVNVDGREETEIGYALMPEYWGIGLATEISEAILGIAFAQLKLDDVVAFTLPDNRASRRVIEKLGGGYERDIVHADLPHVLYRIRSEAWHGNRLERARNV